MLRVMLLLILSVALAACATNPLARLQAGVSTEQDVIAILGKPAQVIENADGSRTLDYSTQPNGIDSRFISLDVKGKVEKIENPLAPVRLEKVTAGMKPQDILQLLGQPGVKEHLRYTTSEIWTWYVGNNNRQAGQRYQIRFTDGVVVRGETSWRAPDDSCTDQSCLNN